MNRTIFYYIFSFAYIFGSSFWGVLPCFSESPAHNIVDHDTVKNNQILFNGKMWRNLYINVKGDQFFFSKEFTAGSLTINGTTFNDIYINWYADCVVWYN